jgi:hypothetical protein
MTAAADQENLAADLAAVARIDAVKTILEVVCRTTGLGFAAVARVTEERWIACEVRDEIAFGLKPGGELPVATTICDQIRNTGAAVVIDHVANDEIFCNHPTPKTYGFQSYISVPIRRTDGRFFGTLCAIDPRPAHVNTPQITAMFQLFANLIAFHLDAQEKLSLSERALLDERKGAELREQFIAVLGHDLRNPLAAIHAGAGALQRVAPGEPAANMVSIIQRSCARMSRLIDNVLDFARGRLGGGLTVSREVDGHLAETLQHVIGELQTAWPERAILSEFRLEQPVACDSARISQLLSNLIANALTHGEPDGLVRIYARSDENVFELAVANSGEPISPETALHLFKPFSRASVRAGQQGLGLGLYIASEIADAHDGTLKVASSPQETRFTFSMPARTT